MNESAKVTYTYALCVEDMAIGNADTLRFHPKGTVSLLDMLLVWMLRTRNLAGICPVGLYRTELAHNLDIFLYGMPGIAARKAWLLW